MAEREHEEGRHLIEKEYGSIAQARATADGESRLRRNYERMAAVEKASSDAYLLPLWKAMRDLVLTPAPDVAALRIKVDLIDKEEVWNDRLLEADCFELVRADIERLRGEA